jgi:glycosyltransferase involved in cell wall biosynthesis
MRLNRPGGLYRPSLGFVFPIFNEAGGSEATALWTIEALRHEFDMTIITQAPMNLPRLNASYGTHLSEGEFKQKIIPVPRIFNRRFDALRGYRLARYAKYIAPEFDLMISGYNILDFGRPGIQLIADFAFFDKLHISVEEQIHRPWIYHRTWPRRAYLALGKLLSGTTPKWKENLTIANSLWTKDVLKKTFDLSSIVIYPPVLEGEKGFSWPDRENGVVFLGRLDRHKGLETIFWIVEQLRARKMDLHLHIVGPEGSDRDYFRYVLDYCQKNQTWVKYEGPLFGSEKFRFLARHRYGISGRSREPFGISVAETVKAGCLIWVPRDGGQVEIVNQEDLLYQTPIEAVEKMSTVMKSPEHISRLRAHLAIQCGFFSPESFMKEIRNVVHSYIYDSSFRSFDISR